MLEYTDINENTNILISAPVINVIEGLDIATPASTGDMYRELVDISNNAGEYARRFAVMANSRKYQFNPTTVYDPNHPDYIASVQETASMDTQDYTNYQSAILGISSVALLSVIVGTVFFSSKRA